MIPFNSLALADEDSIENLLDDMKKEVAELENEYYFLKNNKIINLLLDFKIHEQICNFTYKFRPVYS